MPLYGRRSRPTVNSADNGSSNKDLPFGTKNPVPAEDLVFANAVPTPLNEAQIDSKLAVIDSERIFSSDLPTLATGLITPIFLGEPLNPTAEFLFTNPQFNTNPEFYPSFEDPCIISFLFANVVAKRREDAGVPISPTLAFSDIPYSPEEDVLPSDIDNDYQVIFIDQDIVDNSLLKINGLNLIHESNGSGVPVILGETIEVDSWYNGNFNSYNLANNVGLGYTNDPETAWELGDRYLWGFGSIYFTMNVASPMPECTSDPIESDTGTAAPSNESGFPIRATYTDCEIRLCAWRFPAGNCHDPSVSIYSSTPTGNTRNTLHLPGSYLGTGAGPGTKDDPNDDPTSVDYGIYKGSKVKYFTKVYGKALTTHLLKGITPGKCFKVYVDEDNNIALEATPEADGCCPCDSPYEYEVEGSSELPVDVLISI